MEADYQPTLSPAKVLTGEKERGSENERRLPVSTALYIAAMSLCLARERVVSVDEFALLHMYTCNGHLVCCCRVAGSSCDGM